jgi:Uma2 family endonuclease
MSTTTAAPLPTFLADASVARFSVDWYDRLVADGHLTPEDKVELLENYVVQKTPRDPDHDNTIAAMNEVLTEALPDGWCLRGQLTVALSDSRPEPDSTVVRGRCRDLRRGGRHPEPADVALVIEVSNTSLLRDQRDKARIYARGGIACYWIVNLDERRVEVHTQPSGPCDSPAYASVVNVEPPFAVPLVLDGAQVATVPVADLLP